MRAYTVFNVEQAEGLKLERREDAEPPPEWKAHQAAELAARVTELPVDQHEAFGEEPHMRGGGLGGARRDLDDRRPQPLTQRRGIDPADAVLLQQFGERRLANALRRGWRRQAPPQVERPGRCDLVVNGHSIFPRCGHRKFPHPLLNPTTTTMPVDARGQAVCGLSKSRWARVSVMVSVSVIRFAPVPNSQNHQHGDRVGFNAEEDPYTVDK